MGTAENYAGEDAAFYKDPEVVAAYSARPCYPPEAIRYVLGSMSLAPFADNSLPRILDAGCGTGLLTERLMSEGDLSSEIVAMDQSKAMVVALHERIPEVGLTIGTFDAMPFGDNCFDLITFGTALHWGDPDRVPQELFRVLRPGGIVASIGNVTRVGTEFTAILGELPGHVAASNRMTANPRKIDLGANFVPAGFEEFANVVTRTPDDFDRLLASIEVFEAAPKGLKGKAWQKMQDYAGRHTRDGRITVEFDTHVRIARVIKPAAVGAVACRNGVGLVR